MKKTITKQLMGLALGAFSLTASAQCPSVSSVIPTYNSNGQVGVSINLSGAVTTSNTTYGASIVGNGITSSYTSFGMSSTGTVTYPCNGTYSLVVNYNDSTTMCYGYDAILVTITNSPNTCSTTPTPTNTPCSVFTGSFITSAGTLPGEYNVYAAANYTGTTSFSAYAYGTGFVTQESGFGNTPNGQLTFSENGAYSVCVYLTDTVNGCYDQICGNVNVTTVSAANTPTCLADASFALFQDSTVAGTYVAYNYGGGTGNLSYLWNFGDGTTSTQAYPTHVYASAGFYTLCLTVTATDSTGNSTCTDTQCSAGGFKISAAGQMGKIVVKNPGAVTGVKENNNAVASLNAFPNPMNDELTIEVALTNNSTSLVYTIVDALGKVVAQNKLDDSKAIINTTQLDKGFYFLSISTDKGNVLKSIKIVK